MPTLSDSEVVKTAVDLCNNEALKRVILHPSSRELDSFQKKDWDQEIENEAFNQLNTLPDLSLLDIEEKERIVGAIFSIAIRMLTWTEYQMGIFKFPYEFCFNFLTKELFNEDGIIDEEKVAEKLNSTDLNSKQAFQVACFYCLKDKIQAAFKALTKKEKNLFYDLENFTRVKQLTLIKFWSYYLMGDIDKLRRHKSIDEYRLRCAINSGSKMAVEFCLEKTGLVRRKNFIVDAGVEVIKFRIIREIRSRTRGNVVDDLVAFRKECFNPSEEFFTPNCFLADIFYFILSKMTDDQKVEMIAKFYKWTKNHRIISDCPAHIKCYEYLLYWPYQRRFMDFVKYTLPYLNERSYGSILLDISSRIEPDIGTLWYRENSICDYRNVLLEYWQLASEEVVRYIFSDKSAPVVGSSGEKRDMTFNEGKELIYHLYLHENFTSVDKSIVKTFLDSATRFERLDLLQSSAGDLICSTLIKKEEFDLFDEFLLMCLRDQEEALAFRKRYGFVIAQEKCCDYVRNDRWLEVEEFMKWCYLTDEDIVSLKKDIIKSDDGKDICLELCLSDMQAADRFVEWSFSSEEDAKFYKCLLISDKIGVNFCEDLIANGHSELLNKFVYWCLSSEEKVTKFKKKLVEKYGFSILTKVLFKDRKSDHSSGLKSEWTLADDFLSWCFPNKSDAIVFKKDYFKQYGGSIYSDFIKLNKCFEAAPLFSWFALPSEEIKKLRKCLLFTCSSTCAIFDDMMASEEDDERFAQCGGRQKAIEQLLRWCLIDKETLDEFKVRYRCYIKNPVIRRVTRQLEEKFDDDDDDDGKKHENVKSKVMFMK